MQAEVYSKIKRQYEKKHDLKVALARQKEEKVLKENKTLATIKKQIDEEALKSAKLMLGTSSIERDIEKENLSIKLKKLQEKYDRELEKLGFKKEDFIPDFDCNICNDTGVVINEDNTRSTCKCFEQEIINQMYNDSRMSKLKDENFNTFDTGFYSNKADKEKYGIEKSPLDNILNIVEESKKFCKNINNRFQKNLLFIGNTGLGKTFLANCIACQLINDGRSVIYQTSPLLMDKIIEYKCGYEKDTKLREEYNKILSADLLIIDDLGTETMSNFKFTELFNVINTRILENKKIVISTNLSLNELYKLYDERVMSRIIGNFNIYKFVGEDIRFKKRKIN